MITSGRLAMEVWAEWWLRENGRERGWPKTDSLERARKHAATATKTGHNGRRGSRIDGLWIPGPQIPPPKETRSESLSRAPTDLDRDSWGLAVHRILDDWEREGRWQMCFALKVDAYHRAIPPAQRAAKAGCSLTTFKRLRARGHSEIVRCLHVLCGGTKSAKTG